MLVVPPSGAEQGIAGAGGLGRLWEGEASTETGGGLCVEGVPEALGWPVWSRRAHGARGAEGGALRRKSRRRQKGLKRWERQTTQSHAHTHTVMLRVT